MQLVYIDFETHYRTGFDLTSAKSSGEYIGTTQMQMMGWAIGDGEVNLAVGEDQIRQVLNSIKWEQAAFVSHNCVTGDHEVKTPRGWVRFDELQDTDLVMRVDPTTFAGSYVKPLHIVRKQHNGDVLEWDTQFHKGVYTPEHRMLHQTTNMSSYKFITAEALSLLGQNNNYIPVGYKLFTGDSVYGTDFIRLLEAIRADGSFFVHRKSCARFKVSKERKVLRLKDLCDRLNVKITISIIEQRGKPVYSIYVSGDVVNKIKNLLTHQKTLGDWVMHLSFEERLAWVQELEYWDGSRKRHKVDIHSVDDKTIYWLSEVAESVGYQVKTTYNKPNTRGFSKPDGVIHKLRVRFKDKVKLLRPPTRYQFSGMVYCVTVPTGAFVVRRNGATWVTGNCLFDGRILKQRFGVVPAFYFDTLSMMRATHWNQLFGGATLGHLSKVLQANGLSIEDKGSEVKEAKGKFLYKFKGGTWYMHEEEITAEYLKNLNLTKTGRPKTGKAYKDPREVVANAIQFYQDFADYCIKDVAICRAGFKEMVKLLPREEIYFQDMILRCAMFPQLQMDVPLLKSALTRAQTSLREAVNKIADKWFSGDYYEAKSALLSTGKLAILLKALGGMTQDEVDDYIATEGVHPEPPFIIPTKVSEKKTAKAGEPVYEYALAKKDPGMVELMQNPNEDLQEVLACRKTVVYFNNYEIPRLHRFINEQEYSGEVGMPLKVSGAFTHRLGGDLFNIQNLSSGRNDGQDATMRMSIMATEGRVVVGCDSSQIEARVLAFEANEQIILDEFKNGVDPYCALAEKIYNIPYEEINRRRKDDSDPLHEEAKLQRQAGKAGRLGLGYQMGAVAFVDYAATLGVTLTMEESKRVVDVYRTTYSRTYSFWDQCAEVLKMLVAGQSGYFGGIDGKLFYFDGTRTIAGRRTPGIRLPDGMWLTYTDLQMRERTYPDGSKRWNFCYYGIKEGRPGWIWIYSGKVTENLTQALAFAIMKWQAMNINKRYPIAFNVHDEWVVTCDAADAENCRDYVVACMKQVPPWAVGCPIDAEGAYAKRYGEC